MSASVEHSAASDGRAAPPLPPKKRYLAWQCAHEEPATEQPESKEKRKRKKSDKQKEADEVKTTPRKKAAGGAAGGEPPATNPKLPRIPRKDKGKKKK